jgi:hypothetical protein
VDNCIIVSNDLHFLNHTIQTLAAGFKMTDEGPTENGDGCLGMVIKRNRKHKSLFISQNKHLINILKRFNMFDCKPTSIPLEPKDIEAMKDVPYSTAIGCLIHAMTTTRIDLAYSNGQVNKFMANLGSVHWSAIKRIMKYIKGTLDFKITYKYGSESLPYPHQIQGWSDSD